MSRNGSGTMTVPNTMVAGEVITAADHNENYSDIAAEITNSVAVDGQSTMSGPLKASSGTAAAPSHTFGSDTDTGGYRIGSNNYGIAVGGTKIVDVASTGATVTGDVTATGTMNAASVKQNSIPLLPVGLGPLPWCGISAPAGWVLCYGQSLSRTTYAALWAFAEAEIALGNPLFTNGDGSTTFTILDMRGYVAAGQDDMGGSSANRLTGLTDGVNGDTFGAAGGLETQTLLEAQLPNLTKAATRTQDVALSINYRRIGYTAGGTTGVADLYSTTDAGQNATISPTLFTQPTFSVSFGSGSAHNNVQPTRILNQIIYAGV